MPPPLAELARRLRESWQRTLSEVPGMSAPPLPAGTAPLARCRAFAAECDAARPRPCVTTTFPPDFVPKGKRVEAMEE